MRGEYGSVTYDCGGTVELPPRARRILACDQLAPLLAGTTSACAENTHRRLGIVGVRRNYLRVRGEYRYEQLNGEEKVELPPRARRIQVCHP